MEVQIADVDSSYLKALGAKLEEPYVVILIRIKDDGNLELVVKNRLTEIKSLIIPPKYYTVRE